MNRLTKTRRRQSDGLLLGIGAYLIWGAVPLYYRALAEVAAAEIVAHRTVWSLVFVALVLFLGRRWATLWAVLARAANLRLLAVTASLMAVNLLVYVHAVTSGRVLAASLGYFLSPLVSVLLGVTLLRERLAPAQCLAILLAGLGVAVLAAGAGSGLWISLTLAICFGIYGYLRKVAAVEPFEGLAVEAALLAPFALAWLAWQTRAGELAFGRLGAGVDLLLVLNGLVATIPLMMFIAAGRRLPYSTLGMLQYITPSLQFLIAVLLFGEVLTMAHLTCFAAIWVALAIFVFHGWRSPARSGTASP